VLTAESGRLVILMEEIRSFIAIEIPEPIRQRLGDLQEKLRQASADVKWVRPEGIHLTLKFLGNISLPDVERLAQSLSSVIGTQESFDLRIVGLGGFPNDRNPRVIWVGLDRGAEKACSLQRVIEEETRKARFPSENRAFQPHLTLGRVRSSKGRDALAQMVAMHKSVEIGAFSAEAVYLFKSELKPSGAVYTKLETFPLRGHEGTSSPS
jgi:RNA 2',3'-cyclic 3'-phosphodiesterase